jgi:hypothetical protein
MKKLTFIMLISFILVVAGCTEDDLTDWEMGLFSPVATPVPTPTPDIDAARDNLDSWLDDYLGAGKLW